MNGGAIIRRHACMAVMIMCSATVAAQAQSIQATNGASTRGTFAGQSRPDSGLEGKEGEGQQYPAAAPTSKTAQSGTTDASSATPRAAWDVGGRIGRDQLSTTPGFGLRVNPRIQSRLATRIENRLDRRYRTDDESLRGFSDATNNTRTNPR